MLSAIPDSDEIVFDPPYVICAIEIPTTSPVVAGFRAATLMKYFEVVKAFFAKNAHSFAIGAVHTALHVLNTMYEDGMVLAAPYIELLNYLTQICYEISNHPSMANSASLPFLHKTWRKALSLTSAVHDLFQYADDVLDTINADSA